MSLIVGISSIGLAVFQNTPTGKTFSKTLLFLPLIMVMIGMASIQFKERTFQKYSAVLKQNHISVLALEESETMDYGQKFLAKQYPNGPKLIVHTTQKTPYHYGDKLVLDGHFKPPTKITNPGQSDFQKILKKKGIVGIFKAKEIRKQGNHIYNPFKWIAIQLRHKVHSVFQSNVPAPYDALLIGLVFGDHGIELSNEFEEQFRHVGLTHLLVVSGSQVSLLSGIILTFLQKLKLSRKRIVFLIWIANAIFFFMTGGGASIFRAALMNSIATGLWGLHRNSTPLHICSVTALIMCLISPYYLTDAGAQLSFLATFSLLYGVSPIEKKLPQKWPSGIRTALATAIGPFIWTTPLTATLFHAISPISLLSNIAAVQAIEWLVVVGFTSAFIGLICGPLSLILNHFCLLIMQGLTWLVTGLEKVPGGQFYIPNFPLSLTFLIYTWIIMVFFPLPFTVPKKLVKNTLILIIISLIGVTLWFSLPGKMLTITSLDVGQGDATLIQTPRGKVILIDTGLLSKDRRTGKVKSDMGRDVILPALHHLGINKIDLLIITHFHLDHIGGAPAILEKIPVGTVIDNGCPEAHFKEYERLKRKTKVIVAQAGTTLPIEKNLTLKVLHPFKNQECNDNQNNQSVTVKLTHGQNTFLFTGDLEEEGEALLVSHYGTQLDSDILKLGHHGSKTSSTPDFLAAVTPKLALISSGLHNRYGHPHPSVIERVRADHIPIFNTAQNGAIILLSDGKTLQVKTF